MKDLRLAFRRGLRFGVLIAGLRLTLLAQSTQSTTSLSANTPSLVLPGSLTLTSNVSQAVVPGGVPTGTVAFTFDGTNPLGSAPLKSLPSTQNFPNAPTASISSLGANSAGLVAVDLPNIDKVKPVLVVGNNLGDCSGAATVSVFPNLGGGKFNSAGALTTATCQLSSKPIDQIASGFFLSTTTKSALIHQPQSYNVVDGSTSDKVLTVQATSNAGPSSSSADKEVIAIDDFDGDGYSDVGVLVMADDVVGIALNLGDGSGKFGQLVQVALPSTPPAGETGSFCVDAITTGKFNQTTNAQLAALGHWGANCSSPPPSGTHSYLALYVNPTPAPVLSPASEGFSGGQLNVTISDAIAGATIYYTSDGSIPSTSSTIYTGPIPVTTTTTIEAIAVAPGHSQSVSASAAYTLYTIGATPGSRANHGIRSAPRAPGTLIPLFTGNGSPLIAVGTDQTTLASADFNQDGNVDLLVGSSTAKQVQIFYGHGDGTFTPVAAANNTPAGPALLNINDFNGDGYPDVAMTLDGNGASGFAVLLNDGTGTLKAATQPYPAGSPIAISSADFNSDGLPDLALLQQPTKTSPGSIDTLLSSESAQATLVTPTHSLAVGTHTLVATYSGDVNNFLPSSSSSLSEEVTQTSPTITWATPAPIQLTTPPPTVSNMQLNASTTVPGSFTYNPPLNTQLSLGKNILTTTFVPTDTFDYSDATAQVIQEVDFPNTSATVAILAVQPGADASQRDISLTLSPFPVDVQVTLTLSFTDASSNPATSNGSIKFVSVGPKDTLVSPTVDSFTVLANSTEVQPSRIFSVGTVAGTITLTTQLKLSDGTDVTPPGLAPLTVTVAPTIPVIQKATYSITGKTVTVSTVASSTTREISGVTFHFTPIAGKTLKTTDLPITNPPEFQQWFTSKDSGASGGGFTYTQSFAVSTDADIIGGVTVTLQNGQGQSAPSSAQSAE